MTNAVDKVKIPKGYDRRIKMYDAKLMLAAIAYQNQGEYQIDNASMAATPREIHFEKNPPGRDGIVIRVKREKRME